MASDRFAGMLLGAMLIREPSDRTEIISLADVFQASRDGMVARRRRTIYREGDVGLVGEVDDRPVAIASLRAGPRHPRMVELAVDTSDDAIDGAGPMIDAMIEAAGDRIIECKTADYDVMSHWVRHDPRFRHEITVELGTMATSSRPAPVGLLPAGYTAEGLTEAGPEIEALFEHVYARSHVWTGGVVEFPETGSWLSRVGEPVAVGVVWNRTGRPIAVSGVTVGFAASQAAFLLPGGVLEGEPGHPIEMLSHAVEAALSTATRIGVPEVEYEDSRPDYDVQGAVLDRFERRPYDTTEMWVSRDR